MKLISFDGYDFAAHGYGAGFRSFFGDWLMNPTMEQRQSAPAIQTGGTITPRSIPAEIGAPLGTPVEDAMVTVIAVLRPDVTTPRTLVGELNNGTRVQCEATVQVTGAQDIDEGINWIGVTFITTDPLWTKVASVAVGPTSIGYGALATVWTNNGAAETYPLISRGWSATSNVNDQKRRLISVTNTGELPMERDCVMVPVAGVVSGIFDAPYVLHKGRLIASQLFPSDTISPTATGYLAFPVTIDPGETEQYELIYDGNSDNTALTFRDLSTYTRFDGNYCALDLASFAGAATAGGANTLTDGAASWTANRLKGASVWIVSGTGAVQMRRIISNTATAITVGRAWSTNPSAGSKYFILCSGYLFDGGSASAGAASTLTDAAQSWDAGVLAGGTITIIGGTGSGQSATIASNTGTVITIVGTWGVNPASGSIYTITRPFYHRYYVDQVNHAENHRGGWQINKRFTKPSKVIFGGDVINGWSLYTYLDNNQKNDSYNQARFTGLNVGPTHFFPILDADRRKKSDRPLQDDGQADGVSVYHPFGYRGIRFSYQQKNPNSAVGAVNGICTFLLAGREAGGAELEDFVTDSTLRTSLTSVAEQFVSLSSYGSPEQLYMGQRPFDEVGVANDASENDVATVRWNDKLELYVEIVGKLSYTIGAEERVYRLNDEIQIGNYVLQIGMRDGQRLTLSESHSLVLDCENARALVNTGSALVDVTYAVNPVIREDRDGDGVNEDYIADRWLPLPAGANTVSFAGGSWTDINGNTASVSGLWNEKVYG